jgi:hypothetical protein
MGRLRGKVENLEEGRHKARGSYKGWIKGPDGPYIGWITPKMQREDQRRLEGYFEALEAVRTGEEVPYDPSTEEDPMFHEYLAKLEAQERERRL